MTEVNPEASPPGEGSAADRERRRLLRGIRIWLWLFIIGLVASGATAIPIETELRWLVGMLDPWAREWPGGAGLLDWLTRVLAALTDTNARYPFIAYGFDWLAFGHFVIASAFIGPLLDPVRNVWVIHFGMLACIMVFPFALIMGEVRGIPFAWRLIDCAFGVGGLIPLEICRRMIGRLEKMDKVHVSDSQV